MPYRYASFGLKSLWLVLLLSAGLIALAPTLATHYASNFLESRGISTPVSLSWASAPLRLSLRLGPPEAPLVEAEGTPWFKSISLFGERGLALSRLSMNINGLQTLAQSLKPSPIASDPWWQAPVPAWIPRLRIALEEIKLTKDGVPFAHGHGLFQFTGDGTYLLQIKSMETDAPPQASLSALLIAGSSNARLDEALMSLQGISAYPDAALRLSASGPLNEITLTGSTTVLGEKAAIIGHVAVGTGTGEIVGTLKNMPAATAWALASTFSPQSSKMISVTEGTVSGTATARMKAWALTDTTADITLQKAAGQIGRLALTHVAAHMKVKDPQTFTLETASGDIFGGRFAITPLTLRLPLQPLKATFKLDKIDIAQALATLGPEGLKSSGHLSGDIPFQLSPSGQISLAEGQLRSLEAGVITYRPAQKPAFMSEGGQAAFLGTLFDDFRYTRLTGGVNGTVGDTLTLQIKLEGANPAFYNNRAVAFTLNLSGALLEVLKNGSSGFQLSTSDIADYAKQPHDGKR